MLTGTILLAVRSERITEINIDGIIGPSEDSPHENPEDRAETYEKFQRQLEAIRNISTPEIVVNIRSTGGHVDDALLIHDILAESGKQVTTRCYGYVASAATLIAQAASKGRREMSANGLYLIHQSVSSGAGNADELEQTVDLLNQTDRRIASLYAARSGKTTDHFARLMGLNQGNGKWLCAQQAKTAGLIDRIIPKQEITNEARQAVRMFNLPAIPEKPAGEKTANVLQRVFRRWLETTGWSPGEQSQEIVISTRPVPASTNAAPSVEKKPKNAEIADTATSTPSDTTTPSRPIIPSDPPLRLKALATLTQAKEDPSREEPLLSPNARSYQQDIHQFTR